jgi:hypothetical protein
VLIEILAVDQISALSFEKAILMRFARRIALPLAPR